MSNNHLDNLGITCPSGGNFYVCAGNATEFIGCCTSNPCTESRDGLCPSADLRGTSFDEERYAQIPEQSCDDPRGSRRWFTCKESSTPFMGCCASDDACGEGCPQANLLPAVLSDDAENRLIFLPEGSPTSSPTSSPTPTATPSATPSGDPDSEGPAGMSTGVIAGIAIGAAVALTIIALIIWRFGWNGRRKRKDEGQMPLNPEMGYAHPGGHGGDDIRNSHISYATTAVPYSNHTTPTRGEFVKMHNGYQAVQSASPPPSARTPSPYNHMPYSPGYAMDTENGMLSAQPSPHGLSHMNSMGSVGPYSATPYGHGPGPQHPTISEIDGVQKPPELVISEIDGVERQAPVVMAELSAEEGSSRR